jgi:DNA-binding MarR family transcriptional regulator
MTPNEIEQEIDALISLPLTRAVGVVLRLAHTRVQALYAAAISGTGLTLNEVLVLRLLWNRPLNQVTLANLTHINRNVMTDLIDDLEDRKLVERRKNPRNRREFLVTLTDDGRSTFRGCMRNLVSIGQELQSHFSKSEWEAMLEFLCRLAGGELDGYEKL